MMATEPDNRLDLHNAAIDTEMARAHLCGAIDLRTGRTCIGPVHHRDSCQMVSKAEARRYANRTPRDTDG